MATADNDGPFLGYARVAYWLLVGNKGTYYTHREYVRII